MDRSIIEQFGSWYLIIIDSFLIIGSLIFFRLPNSRKTKIFYWLPYVILAFTVFYENLGAYTNYNLDFKKSVNALLGNTENPNYNLWVFNICFQQITTILYLLLIRNWLEPTKKKIITWMLLFFVITAFVLQITGIEPLYLDQPIISAMGANMILIGSGLYFMGLITNQYYLETEPLRLISFWQMTFLLFTYSLTYISSVAYLYLYEFNPDLGQSISQIDMYMGIINIGILILIIASPLLPNVFLREPLYEPN
ncbi:histidine kinase [Algoriphagus halophilus]|uniref:Histidine kinase N-terminal 7TM region domain-containing protein n=1 Tax=Algoriphagus halophilus TaxID=226505 RepID=A0A1N6FTY9_9BACT|nr:histidine kinase [Algoriphagus halophilus]SIN98690.1 hypothetical protein SAMN05444394_2722 [Algoriphagus halophilus]